MAVGPDIVLALLAFAAGQSSGRRRGEPGVPPEAFSPSGSRVIEPVTFPPSSTSPVSPESPMPEMQKGAPAVSKFMRESIEQMKREQGGKGTRQRREDWEVAKRPTAQQVQTANVVLRSADVPTPGGFLQGDSLYRKIRSGGKTIVVVYNRRRRAGASPGV